MVDIAKIQRQIVERIGPLSPEKIILFGSYAKGTPTADSDIDLYVVTNDDFIPQNWQEKNRIYLGVSRKIRDLRKQVPIDLIVHTKKMHEKFIALNSFFSREINQEGVRLL
ncbi:MAG: nucleotidyltransferase domain-containing protein [Planctomycetota bacterium]|nr:MAG: nucleotidyltransferase domain-containing protein [Planctomycetota bacterium]